MCRPNPHRLRRLPLLLILVAAAAAWAVPAAGQTAIKLAVIDVERILLESNRGKAALEEIDALRQQMGQQAQGMQKEITDLRTRIQEGGLSLAEGTLADLRKQLEDKMIALQRFNDDATRELTKKRNEVLDQIEQSVFPVINQIGKEGGYTLIFNKFNSGLVYADETVDITARVIERYNQSTSGGG